MGYRKLSLATDILLLRIRSLQQTQQWLDEDLLFYILLHEQRKGSYCKAGSAIL
jgi:hypothetical protein